MLCHLFPLVSSTFFHCIFHSFFAGRNLARLARPFDSPRSSCLVSSRQRLSRSGRVASDEISHSSYTHARAVSEEYARLCSVSVYMKKRQTCRDDIKLQQPSIHLCHVPNFSASFFSFIDFFNQDFFVKHYIRDVKEIFVCDLLCDRESYTCSASVIGIYVRWDFAKAGKFIFHCGDKHDCELIIFLRERLHGRFSTIVQ